MSPEAIRAAEGWAQLLEDPGHVVTRNEQRLLATVLRMLVRNDEKPADPLV